MKTAAISVELVDSCGSDLSVVNAARVSFAKVATEMGTKDTSLINYLAKHKHTSPFNHAFLSFRIKAPIFVARQLVKHKFMPWNEVSRRYVDEEPEFYYPAALREKALDKKQGSGGAHHHQGWLDTMQDMDQRRVETYLEMINTGVCPEQARMHLPQNTMTEWIWSGTLGAFCDMLRLRLKEDTQEETREVAIKLAKYVAEKFPVSYNALIGEANVN